MSSNPLVVALQPLSHILYAPETEDLAIQEPGVGWWLKGGAWHRIDLPAMTYSRMHGISVMAAAQTRQVINERKPILACDLPGGLRLQAVMPPAVTPNTLALTFRRGDERLDDVDDVARLWGTSRWNKWEGRDERRMAQNARLLDCYDRGDLAGFLRALAETKQTGLICGPTGAGKSRLSKLLGGAIPLDERIITIENASELVIRQQNNVRHYYSGSEGDLTAATLMKAALRERPDRVLLGEMRDSEEAAVFVDAVMSAHPGSMSTVHGRNPPEAARRLFNLVKGAARNRGTADDTIIAQLNAAIDFIIPVENVAGMRDVGEVWVAADAQRRGEGFRELMVGL